MKVRSSNLRSWPKLAVVSVLAATAITLISVSNPLTTVSANEEPGWRTLSRESDFPNYDIREDAKAGPVLNAYRQSSGRSDSEIDSIRKQFYAGEKRLREKVSNVRIEYNTDLKTAGLIAGDTGSRLILTAPSKEKRAEILRSFIKQNEGLIGLDAEEADKLHIRADYTNPDGNLSYAHLEQFIGDIPVFRSEIKAAFTKKGEMFRVINNLAPALDENVIPREFGEPKVAIENAFKYVSRSITSSDLTLNDRDSSDTKSVFGTGDSATVAEKTYFPTDPGVVRPSWRVLIWQSVNAYYVIVDAETGTLLWRKNLTSDQTQSATYSIYSGDSPGPLSPSSSLPGSGIQGPSVGRTSVTLIGNEAPNLGQNNLGWITDGNNTTDGNNVEAGTDLTSPDGVDAPVTGSPNRVFNFAYDPPPGGGDSPTGANYRNGAVTNLFYWCNRYHDLLYSVGFTEAAANFQNSNFGRGGAQNDRLRAEIQDFSGTNNANFTTPADGSRPKMQMYIFTGPTPQRDSSLDAEVFLHELTHGVSSRIIGNGTGLTTLRGQSLGEGWSDFFSRLILATPDEDINGVFPVAGYSTLDFSPIGTDNFYYGIRRFPYALKTARGGVPLRPFNPLTFADIDIHQADVSDGAFPASPLVPNVATEEHNAGEVWCMALLEVRSRVISNLGFVNGSKRMAQLVVDGMKLSPVNPDFIQARDAIIAADEANFAGEDLDQIWAGFASRGMGFGATDNATTLAVDESFLLPNAVVVSPFSVSDAAGDNDGSPEPGEHVTLSVTVTNTTGTTLSNVVVTTETGTFSNYGSLANGATKSRQIPYTIPFTTGCGGMQKVELKVTSSAPGANVFIRRFRLGVPPTAPQTFSNTNPITINDGLATAPAKATPYGGPLFVSGLTGSKVMRLGFTGFSHTFLGDVDILLVGPNGHKMIVMSDAGGGVNLVNTDFSLIDSASEALPISGTIDDGGEYQPANYDATDTFPSPAPAGPYPSPVTSGTSTFASVFGTDASQLNGTWQIYIVDDFGGDAGSISGGWYLKFESSDFVCSFHAPAPPRADFDGDGRSDVSVQRPSDGSWFAVRSSDGGSFTNTWGNLGDVTTPGDFDGDGKTDLAVYRASSGQWFVLRSSDSSVTIASWGNPGDVPEAGDFDGDGKTDITVYRPSTGVWYGLRSSDGGVSISGWGNPGDVPVPADYDGDGKTDVAVYRPSNGVWYMLNSTTSVQIVAWGQPGDKPVPADYDGDGKDDFGVYRPSDNNWYVLNSAGGVTIANWGNATDVPVPGDYDGDGKSDIAVFRTGNWYILKSTGGVTISALGTSGDVAIPARYLP